ARPRTRVRTSRCACVIAAPLSPSRSNAPRGRRTGVTPPVTVPAGSGRVNDAVPAAPHADDGTGRTIATAPAAAPRARARRREIGIEGIRTVNTPRGPEVAPSRAANVTRRTFWRVCAGPAARRAPYFSW